MRFRTTVLESDGSTVQAELEAVDEQALHAQVHRQGKTLLRVKAVDDGGATGFARPVVLKPRRLLLLTQAWFEALDAGVPLLATLRAVIDQEEDERVVQLLEDLGQRIEAGQTFSDALAAHPRAFPPLYCALVRAGEQSGSLPRVLNSITGFLEWRLEIASVVKQAMIYPIVVGVAGYAMLLFMLSFVIPRLGTVLSKMGGELPRASRILIDCSGFVSAHILAIVLGSVAAVVAGCLAFRTESAKDAVARVLAGLPVVRNVVGTLAIAQFCRTFGLLLQAGLTMTHALDLGAAAVASPQFRDRILQAKERILGGTRLIDATEEAELLPPVALSMVKVGEEAGRLPTTFERLSQLYDREVKAAVRRALSLMEPVITVVLGLAVGGVAVLVVTTIYSAMKGIGK
jgi:type II secretory pathway component PulF